MDQVLLIVISKSNICLYLLAVLATYLLLKYHKGKTNQPMITKKQILEAVAAYAAYEVELERATDYADRREALFNSYSSWDALEKLVTEATEGPF